MKKQLSSLDLHFLLKELEALIDTRIDKIYQPEKNIIIFSLYKSSEGKKLLKISIGQSIFIAREKEDYGKILGFGMFLRKHLDGCFLHGIEQIEPERIIKLTFMAKEDKKYLYLEFFGKGNMVLCNEHDVIINALEHHEFRERNVKPKLKYVYPVMGCNMFDLNEKVLSGLLRNSKRESLVTCLAVELGLGGIYSEEVCLISDIDKSAKPQNINEKQAHSILISIKKIISRKAEPVIVSENNSVIDFAPFDLKYYSGEKYSKQKFQTFSEALNRFYSQFREIKETEFERKLKTLNRIIEQQKQAIEELRKEEHELRQKGESIYKNYRLIKEILDELNKASKKYSWKEIKEKLKEHKIVRELNEKERKIVVEI